MKLSACGVNWYLRRMTRTDAEEIAAWRYTGGREIYNAETTPESIREFLDGCHFSLSRRFGGRPEAFVSFGESAALPLQELRNIYEDESYTDLSLGLKPELCGQGLGRSLAAAAVRFCAVCFPGDGFRLTVARDNVPALRIYRDLGFSPVAEFTAEVIYPAADGTRTKPVPMTIMTALPDAADHIN